MHTKSSILIGLFCNIMILSTKPSVALWLVAVLGSVLIYSSTFELFVVGERSFFFLISVWYIVLKHTECDMCSSHVCLTTRVLVHVLFREMSSFTTDLDVGQCHIALGFLIACTHFRCSPNHGQAINRFLPGVIHRSHFFLKHYILF